MLALLLDLMYLAAILLAAPWLLYKAATSGKYRSGWLQKLFGLLPERLSERRCVWLHAVSVGEVLLLRRVVRELCERRPDWDIVVSTTTNTGMQLAREHFARHHVCYFPLDFSWSVRRALSRIRPDLVLLAELELWPNFIAAARRTGARVAVINGRMSPRSYRGYRRLSRWIRPTIAQIDCLAVQNSEYACRFLDLGARMDQVIVTGSVKYDGVELDRDNAATRELRDWIGLSRQALVWVAGSTSDPEEEMVLQLYDRLAREFPELRLILVPRHKERFQQVAGQIRARGLPMLRRSERAPAGGMSLAGSAEPAVVLVDTLGELSAVWGLADIAFVGGSFAPRGGQNMIEPAGYGAAVVVGPGVWNFQDTVDQLLGCGGAVQVSTAGELEAAIAELARDAGRRARMGTAARRFVQAQQGATGKTLDLIKQLMDTRRPNSRRAA